MRHRKRGRRLGRSSSHRKAMLRNLASSLFLTERDAEFDDNAPKIKGRVITTLPKAKEVRPLVEKCITIARRSLEHQDRAAEFSTEAERHSDEWKEWRKSDEWRKWNEAIAPAVCARRRALQLLGDKEAVQILFEEVAPRYAERDGGYTRILRLAARRVGDAGQRAILEFVGVRDRTVERSERPSFADDEPLPEETTPEDTAVEDESAVADESSADDVSSAASADSITSESDSDEDKNEDA